MNTPETLRALADDIRTLKIGPEEAWGTVRDQVLARIRDYETSTSLEQLLEPKPMPAFATGVLLHQDKTWGGDTLILVVGALYARSEDEARGMAVERALKRVKGASIDLVQCVEVPR